MAGAKIISKICTRVEVQEVDAKKPLLSIRAFGGILTSSSTAVFTGEAFCCKLWQKQELENIITAKLAMRS